MPPGSCVKSFRGKEVVVWFTPGDLGALRRCQAASQNTKSVANSDVSECLVTGYWLKGKRIRFQLPRMGVYCSLMMRS